MSFVWVFIGGGFGSISRFGISKALGTYPYLFPWATLAANLLSCLLLGILVGLNIKGGLKPQWQYLLMTGFCGGFSTFSTFAYENFSLLQDGYYWYAFWYLVVSLILGIGLVFLGIRLAG